MATTNQEIIMGEVLTRGITEDVHTYSKWKSLGYQVKKGEKALFQTMLWKMSKGKKQDNIENTDNENNENDNKDKKKQPHFFLAKSSMFGRSQVELITQ